VLLYFVLWLPDGSTVQYIRLAGHDEEYSSVNWPAAYRMDTFLFQVTHSFVYYTVMRFDKCNGAPKNNGQSTRLTSLC
jgi:hypothetical protein